jgi:uncharacterized protein YndB with AHSA1/START domain
VTTPTDREFQVTRVFDAPPSLVFEVWTDPRHLPRWMLGPEGWTMPVCEIDLRPGGTWHFVWRRSDRTEMGMRGQYREVKTAPAAGLHRGVGRRLARNHQHAGPLGGEWQDEMSLTILYRSMEARDASLQTGMAEGMSTIFDRLAGYVRTWLPTVTQARDDRHSPW